MGAKSQRKGRQAELELCRILQQYGCDARPGQAVSFGSTPDVVGLPGVHIEVKRCEKLNLSAALQQAVEDACRFKDGAPAVFHRRSRQPWLVTMRLTDWLALYQTDGHKTGTKQEHIFTEKTERHT